MKEWKETGLFSFVQFFLLNNSIQQKKTTRPWLDPPWLLYQLSQKGRELLRKTGNCSLGFVLILELHHGTSESCLCQWGRGRDIVMKAYAPMAWEIRWLVGWTYFWD